MEYVHIATGTKVSSPTPLPAPFFEKARAKARRAGAAKAASGKPSKPKEQ